MRRLRFGAVCSVLAVPVFALASGVACGAVEGEAHVEEVVVETVWRYSRLNYASPIVVDRDERQIRCAETPEEAAVAQTSAVFALDYERWLAGHDAISQEELVEEARRAKAGGVSGIRTPVDWVAGWQKQILPQEVLLIERIETPNFTVVVFEMRPRAKKGLDDGGGHEAGAQRGTLTFVRMSGCWLQTRRFAGHPVPRLLSMNQPRMQKYGKYQDD